MSDDLGRESLSLRVKRMVINNPNLRIEDLMAKLAKDGYIASRFVVASIRQDTRATLRLLKEARMLDIDL